MGCTLQVRLTPKSSRDQIDGVVMTPDGPALQARVRAIPADNAANEALAKLIAKWLRIPKTSVSLTAGAKSRHKTLAITGDSRTLVATIREKISATQS